MQINMQIAMRCALVLAAASFATSAAYAQQRPAGGYPTRAVRIIVPYTPGGPTDLLARVAGQSITDAWAQPFVIDNRPGASGNAGTLFASKQPADGYTLNSVGISFSVAPSLEPRPGFDPVKDFTPITLLATVNNLLTVHPALPVRNVKELVALARSRPNEIPYASGGNGGAQHLSAELFSHLAKVKLVHVPYKGSAPGLTALIGGEVSIGFGDMVITQPHVKSGKLRGLAVTGPARSSVIPELPTIAESGLPGFAFSTWFGLLAPAGLPQDIQGRLNAEVTKALKTPGTRERLSSLGAEPVGNTPEEFAKFLRTEIDKWAGVVRAAGIKGE